MTKLPGEVKEMFRNVIKTYERIGTCTTPENEKVDIKILEVDPRKIDVVIKVQEELEISKEEAKSKNNNEISKEIK